jgi:phage terminase small subunit
MPISPKRQRFVDEFLKDLNATAAYKRAGYMAKGHAAETNASRLLKDPDVAAAIAAKQEARAVKTGIDQARVLAELELLAFSNLEHYVVDDHGQIQLAADAPAGAMRALQSIKRKIMTRSTDDGTTVTREIELRLWDKPGPLKLAGQHVGLFVEKHEHTGKNGKPIEVVKKVVFGGRHRKPQEQN